MKFKLLFKPILFRNIKQMKFKKNKFYTPILLPILAVSLMSIGFSSWYLGENYSINLDNLEVITGETKDLSDFILFNNCINNNAIIIPEINNITSIPNKNEFLAFLCIGFVAITNSSL